MAKSQAEHSQQQQKIEKGSESWRLPLADLQNTMSQIRTSNTNGNTGEVRDLVYQLDAKVAALSDTLNPKEDLPPPNDQTPAGKGKDEFERHVTSQDATENRGAKR